MFASHSQVIWTLITLAPLLEAGRPASRGVLRVLHYLALSYSAFEIPFSLYYRYLAIKAQARRPNPQYTRKFLRDVLRRSLANGLELEDDDEEEFLEALAMGELTKVTSREESQGSYKMRKRKANWSGAGGKAEGPATPELSSAPTLSQGPDTSTQNQSNESVETKQYAPSFLPDALECDDPRAHDFRKVAFCLARLAKPK